MLCLRPLENFREGRKDVESILANGTTRERYLGLMDTWDGVSRVEYRGENFPSTF